MGGMGRSRRYEEIGEVFGIIGGLKGNSKFAIGVFLEGVLGPTLIQRAIKIYSKSIPIASQFAFGVLLGGLKANLAQKTTEIHQKNSDCFKICYWGPLGEVWGPNQP